MSAARKLDLSEATTNGPSLRLYRGCLEETGSEVAAAILADAHYRGNTKTLESAVAAEPGYLTVKPAAERLQVSERTISRMIDNGLRVTRAGKTVRIRPADLEEFDTRFD